MWPDANVAVVTGAISGIVVIDVDPRHGGDESVRDLEITPTTTALTGGGGCHYIYQHPGSTIPNGANLLPGIDVRGDGGYIIAPPSVHSSGRQYEWEGSYEPWVTAPVPLPEELLKQLQAWHPSFGDGTETPQFSWEEAEKQQVVEGDRNTQMTRLAGHLVGSGLDSMVVLDQCMKLNTRNYHPPLPAEEVMDIVRSIRGREEQKAEIKEAVAKHLDNGRIPDEMDGTKRQAVAAELWKELGVSGFQSWKLFHGKEGEYVLITSSGEVSLGGDILNQAAVRRAILNALAVMVPIYPVKAWQQRALLLRQAAIVDTFDTSMTEQTEEWIEAFLEQQAHNLSQEWDTTQRRDAFHEGAIRAAGATWVRVAKLCGFVEASFGEKVPPPQMRKRLKASGWEPGILSLGETTTRGWRKSS